MKPEMTQPELLQQAKSGDFDAFAALTEPYRRGVCEFLARIIGESSAEDVFMKTTLNAWRSLNTFTGRSSYKTWIFSIARFAALDELRKEKTRNEQSIDDEESGTNITQIAEDQAVTPAAGIEGEERRAIVEQALQTLPETHRSVLILYYYQDFQYAEIAKTLNISVGTVMSRLHHAKSKLGKALRPYRNDLI